MSGKKGPGHLECKFDLYHNLTTGRPNYMTKFLFEREDNQKIISPPRKQLVDMKYKNVHGQESSQL